MRIKQKGEVTTITYVAKEQIEKAKMIGLFLLAFPGLPILMVGSWFPEIPGYKTYVGLFYLLAVIGLLLLGSFERKIEIHPERIYVKDYILSKEKEFKIIKDKMVLMLENDPFVQFFIPMENWRLSIGTPDGIKVFTDDVNDYFYIRKITKIISEKLNLPVVDYTYQDQNDIVMFLMPGEVDMAFSQRVIKFPDLLVVGDLPGDKLIREEIKTPREFLYLWTPFSWNRFVMISLTAGVVALLVFMGIIGAKDSLIDIPLLQDNTVIYYIILLVYLAALTYHSAVKKTLFLNCKNIEYTERFFGFKLKDKIIKTDEVEEVRLKPSPAGFITLVIGEEKMLSMQSHFGGMTDFANMLWLTGKVQDFLLKNRGNES